MTKGEFMLSFNQYLTEKKKDKVHFNPDDVSQNGTVAEDSQLDEFSLNLVKIVKKSIARGNLDNTHAAMAKKIDTSKNHNFITRAIARGKLEDKMRKQRNAMDKREY